MSDTPETDSYVNRDWWTLFRANEHARELERERDEARKKIEQQRKEIVRLNGATSHAGGTPLKIALRERDEAREKIAKITKAAEAVIDRWEQPVWKDTEPTAAVIYRLRDALGREEE